MTQNQIEYWKLQEALRHNQATEAETERAAKASLRETKRANKAKEKENLRHNASTESIALAEAGVGMERNRIDEQKMRNAYELGIVENVIRERYNDRYFELANNQLVQDWNKAMLAAKTSQYATDASRTVGLTQAAYSREVGLTSARNNYLVGMENARVNEELGTERNKIAEDTRKDDFIIQSARNRADRKYKESTIENQIKSNEIADQRMKNDATIGAMNTFVKGIPAIVGLAG